jgi:hypothetical protein
MTRLNEFAYVHDAEHGWNELHPVTSMQPIEMPTP